MGVQQKTDTIKALIRQIEETSEHLRVAQNLCNSHKIRIEELRLQIAKDLHGVEPGVWVWSTRAGRPRKLHLIRKIEPRQYEDTSRKPWIYASPITLNRKPAKNSHCLFADWVLATASEVSDAVS